MIHTSIKLVLIISVALLASCASTALFDQYSFDRTISAKVESLSLMQKAIDDYEDHETLIEDHFKELAKVYEYDKRRTNNTITTKMWEILLNEEANLFAGFIKRWREGGPQNKVFVDEASKQIEEAFDLLLDFEAAKNKEEMNSIGLIMNTFINSI